MYAYDTYVCMSNYVQVKYRSLEIVVLLVYSLHFVQIWTLNLYETIFGTLS